MSIDKNWKIDKIWWNINELLWSMSAKVDKDLASAEKKSINEMVLDKAIWIAEKLNNPLNQSIEWLREEISKIMDFTEFGVFKISEWNIYNIGWDWYKLWEDNINIIQENLNKAQDWELINIWDLNMLKIWNYIVFIDWKPKVEKSILKQVLTLSYNWLLITAQNIETKKAALITA